MKIHPKLDVHTAKEVINASDMIICSGFIDMHSHTDVIGAFISE
ncbi:MAG: hypothetical protein ACFE94_12465 [Candidatus Hodarchaeota archaeon]